MTDLAPELAGLREQLEPITGDEPMLSKVNLLRMGRMQRAFMEWLKVQLSEAEEITLLAAWRWVDEWTGNVNCKRRHRDRYKQYTSAGLARLLHSFHKRGLILVIKHDDGFSFIKARTGLKVEEAECSS